MKQFSIDNLNLGNIALPDGMMMPRVRSPYNCGMYSYNGKFFINLCRFPKNSELEELFTRKLHQVLFGEEQST